METKNIRSEKQHMRETFLKRRNDMTPFDVAQESTYITKEFLDLDVVKNSSKICVYVSTKQEVQTRDLIEKLLSAKKEVFVPKCLTKGLMECYQIHHHSHLVEGKFGILEPNEQCMTKVQQPDVIVVPGVCFDVQGYRIGYGGGYYDRYLKRFPLAYTVGFCFWACVCESVPKESFDERVDKIITQRK